MLIHLKGSCFSSSTCPEVAEKLHSMHVFQSSLLIGQQLLQNYPDKNLFGASGIILTKMEPLSQRKAKRWIRIANISFFFCLFTSCQPSRQNWILNSLHSFPYHHQAYSFPSSHQLPASRSLLECHCFLYLLIFALYYLHFLDMWFLWLNNSLFKGKNYNMAFSMVSTALST